MDPDEPQAWWDLPAPALAAQMARLVEVNEDETDLFWELFYFYNHLMTQARDAPLEIVERASAVVAFFHGQGGGQFEAMFHELVARAYLQAGRSVDGALALERMMAEAIEDQHAEILELANDAWAVSAHEIATLDLRPVVLASITRVFRALGELEPLANVFLEAAEFYSKHGADKSADRALDDALTIAQDAGLSALEARVHEHAAMIAFEQQDAPRSVASAGRALDLLSRIGREPSERLRINLATALIQIDQVDEAAAIYEEMLEVVEDDETRASLYTNLASCRRRQGNLAGSTACIARARALLGEDARPEYLLELELIAARSAAEEGNQADLVSSLLETSRLLDAQLAQVLRLHHRRGLRERFVARIEGLLAALPAKGAVELVLPVFAVLYGNLVADWLAMLDWAEDMAREPAIAPADKSDLARRMTTVRQLGAPFLIGFREKHDDPWQPAPMGRPWDDLAEIVERLVRGGAPEPLARVNRSEVVRSLNARLQEGYCLVFPTFAHDPAHIWFLEVTGYRRVDVGLRSILEWSQARRVFEADPRTRGDFIKRLWQFVNEDAKAVGAAFDDLSSSCRGILHMQDFGDALPMSALVLAHAPLRARMAAGEFEVRTVPALYPGRDLPALNKPGVVALVDSSDNLHLARDEAEVAANVLGTSRFVRLEADETEALVAALADNEVLIVSTHGQSLARFVDPFVAELGVGQARHSVTVETIQARFPDLGYRLVALNACHAGAAVARNSEQRFRTHDAASYPALLLLNRRSVVVASSWTLHDTIGYLNLILVAQGIAEGLQTTIALGRAAARLRDLTKTQALALLSLAPASPERLRAEQELQGGPGESLFSHSFATGGLSAYSLL